MTIEILMFYTRGGQPVAHKPHAALCLVSSGSYTRIKDCLSCICLLQLKSVRYFHMRGMYRVDAPVFREFDVALCGIKVETGH